MVFKFMFLHSYQLFFYHQRIDSFLSVKGSSNWITLTFVESTDFSSDADYSKKCYCCFYRYSISKVSKNFALNSSDKVSNVNYLFSQFVFENHFVFDQSLSSLWRKISQCNCAFCYFSPHIFEKVKKVFSGVFFRFFQGSFAKYFFLK